MTLGIPIMEAQARQAFRGRLERDLSAQGVELDAKTWSQLEAALGDARVGVGPAGLQLLGLEPVERILRNALPTPGVC